jgi:large subunit ribosomal protein L29
MIKTSKIREMTSEEQKRRIVDLKEELFNLRFQHGVGQLDNNRKLVNVKRDIARIKTVINEASGK